MGRKNKKHGSSASGDTEDTNELLKKAILDLVNKILEKCTKPQTESKEWEEYLEMYALVDELCQKQKGFELNSFTREDNIAEFISWLKSNSVNTDAVSIHKFKECGWGLQADRNIQASELFLSIPRKLMMTINTARSSLLGPLILVDRMLQAMPNVVLALHLLVERVTPDSFWLPYIQNLPSKFTTPLYFTPDELQCLKGSPVLSDIISQFRNIARQYAYFYKLFQSHSDAARLPLKKSFCFEDYRWAVSAVMTRQNQIPNESGEQMINALIPYWDMCNHCNGQITTDFDLEKNCSVCYAFQDFKEGDQVKIFYGARTNAEFLVHSGFVYLENVYDNLRIKLGISKNDDLYGLKAELLARLGILPSKVFLLHYGDQPVDSELITFLRVFQMNEDELKDILTENASKELNSKLGDVDKIVNKDNEVKAWSFLEIRSTLLLKSYPTTLQEDEEMLKEAVLTEHKILNIQMRLCEKQILRKSQAYAAQKKQAVVAEHDPDKNEVQ